MPRRPTLGSVTKEAGVSIPTVSQVLRGTGRISEKTREKVLKATKKLHYVPDSRAASIRSGENREIGFVINQLLNPFNAEVVSGVVALLEAEGYLVSILDTRDDAIRQGHQLEAFIRNGRGGLLWVPATDTPQETFDMLRAQRTPTVTFMRPSGHEFDHLGIRDADATAAATTHLLNLGHKHIAFLGGTDLASVRRARIAGFQNTMASRGLNGDVVWPCEDNKRGGMDAFFALNKHHPEVTAVVCIGDMVALGACLALIRMGLRPGVDVSVMGFDNIDDAALATPSLSTMAISPMQMGAQLAHLLLERIRDPDLPIRYAEVSAELIIRETTGPRS